MDIVQKISTGLMLELFSVQSFVEVVSGFKKPFVHPVMLMTEKGRMKRMRRFLGGDCAKWNPLDGKVAVKRCHG